IRKDYRFSSGEPVTAESFRHEIERVLSPKFPWFEPSAGRILGASEYHSGQSRQLRGVSAQDDMLVIRLAEPSPDLPRTLALNLYRAVPASTPVVSHGVDAPIPSAGPYYLAAHTDSVAVLKRNTYYRGPRPHQLDAIVYHLGVSPADAVGRIAAGRL